MPSGALALDAGTGVASTGAGRMVKFRDGVVTRHWARDLLNSPWEDVRKLMRKKRCVRVFRLG